MLNEVNMFKSDLPKQFYASQHCLQGQQEINSKMRKVLVDWLIEVHLKFKLKPETLFISVNLLDRYTEKNHIPRKDYQMVGVTCLMIAAKYEEIYPPLIENFLYFTDNAYRAKQILNCEV